MANNEVSVQKLENVSNDLLLKAQDFVYTITHFINKTNKSTALDVRKASRELSKLQKEFKSISIDFYKDAVDDK